MWATWKHLSARRVFGRPRAPSSPRPRLAPPQFWSAGLKFAKASSGELATLGGEIVDKYLCSSAEFQVNLPSKLSAPFAKKASEGGYEWKHGMFGDASSGQLGEIYSLVMRDTFARFKCAEPMRLLCGAGRPHA